MANPSYCCRTLSKVEAAAQEIGDRAMALHCDVASPDSVRAAFAAIAQRHATIDVLINNAAIFEPFQIVDATDEQILNTLATNLGADAVRALGDSVDEARRAHYQRQQ